MYLCTYYVGGRKGDRFSQTVASFSVEMLSNYGAKKATAKAAEKASVALRGENSRLALAMAVALEARVECRRPRRLRQHN